MMYHRKCTNFPQNNFKFQSSTCWFVHDEEMEIEEISKDMKGSVLVFLEYFREKETSNSKGKDIRIQECKEFLEVTKVYGCQCRWFEV